MKAFGIEQLRDGLAVVAQVVLVAVHQLLVHGLEFHQDQRQAVDEADHVRAAGYPCRRASPPTAAAPPGSGCCAAVSQSITWTRSVRGWPSSPVKVTCTPPLSRSYSSWLARIGVVVEALEGEDFQRLTQRRFGQRRVQAPQGLQQLALQDHAPAAVAAQQALRTEAFVHRVDRAPAQLPEQVHGGLLDQGVLAEAMHGWRSPSA